LVAHSNCQQTENELSQVDAWIRVGIRYVKSVVY
jgi:hypothetical protein